MYRPLYVLVAVLCLSVGCSRPSAKEGAIRPDDERILAIHEAEVTERFETFIAAFQEADADALSQMLTEDYVHTGPTGNVSNKTEWINWIRSRRAEMEAGTYRYDTYEIENLNVRVLGNAAIITGLNRASGVRNGEAFAFQIQFTNVWVQQDGVWKRTAFHDSRKE